MASTRAFAHSFFHPGVILVTAVSVSSAVGCGSAPEAGSGESDGEGETVATTSEAVTGTAFFDDLAAPAHIEVMSCGTTVRASSQTLDCTLDSGFTLVGGAASTTGFGDAVLTASVPLSDGRTWRGASRTPAGISSPHDLSVRAIGLRLDGINAATLRSKIQRVSISVPPVPQGSSSPSLSIGMGSFLFGGGAQATTNGAGQFLTGLWANAGSWGVSSRDFVTSSPGWINGVGLKLITTGILEGFGALDIQQVNGNPTSLSTASVNVTNGWAVAGVGATATTTSGPGRLLFRIDPNNGIRTWLASSSSPGQSSQGLTQVQVTQVRKAPNSHGLCNGGPPLSTSIDSCVGTVCAQDSFCCNTFWDGICVGEVTSMCGRSCTDYTCSPPTYTPSLWSNNDPIQFNNSSYNYATNRRTDTLAQPGRASGENCVSSSCVTVANIAKYATADGLVPTTLAAGCGDARSLLAFAVKPAPSAAFRFYRRDGDGSWSYKPDGVAASHVDASGNLIFNIETANRGVYTTFGGYFCACSDSAEGQGHSVIN